uniref:Uncharacterized protein n=1 Tax=Acanthochromis polyacanthus TaxID=80966 RepID=A0A3Q1GWP7_9TELE
MAEKIAVVESFLSCHVCSETFRDPVSLSCNHNFCSSCLKKFWEQTENKNCPICKRKSSKEFPGINFGLKELADSFAGRQKPGSSEIEKQKEKDEVVCEKHPEIPYWFCEDEQRSLCPVCEFSLHQSRKVVPIEQAVSDLKDQLKSELKSLQDKRDKYKQVEETYSEMREHTKKQLLSTERQIRQQLPDNPERITLYPEVLGSEGFSSGKHSWEVEVGDHPRWNVGLVKESANKNEASASPEYGFWCLEHGDEEYMNGADQTFRVKKSLQRIRVQLDYDRGEVSFYHSEDMTHICTHRDTFTEKLFPYFCVAPAKDAKTTDIKICHSDISLSYSGM